MKTTLSRILVVSGIIKFGFSQQMKVQDRSLNNQGKKIEELERKIKELGEQLRTLKDERSLEKTTVAAKDETITWPAIRVMLTVYQWNGRD